MQGKYGGGSVARFEDGKISWRWKPEYENTTIWLWLSWLWFHVFIWKKSSRF